MNLFTAIACLVLIIICTWFLFWVRHVGKAKVIGYSDEVLGFLKHSKLSLWYFPHYRISLSTVINSSLGISVGRDRRYRPKREIVHGMDGGEFGLDWFTLKGNASDDIADDLPNDTPILVIEHGLSGGSSERYVQHIGLRARRELGWRSVCILMRGCCGTRLTTPKIYHVGQTEDIHSALTIIHERYPKAPVLMTSYSMGANMVVKYLGEQYSKNHCRVHGPHVDQKTGIVPNIIGAVAVGCPFNVKYSVDHYSNLFKVHIGSSIFNYIAKHKEFLDTFPKLKGKIDAFKAKGDFTEYTVSNEFAPLFESFRDADDYHTDTSSDQYMDGIHTPLLCISAKNDPISPPACIPIKTIEENPHISAILCPGGAHLGYFRFASVYRTFDEDFALEFFKYRYSEWKKTH